MVSAAQVAVHGPPAGVLPCPLAGTRHSQFSIYVLFPSVGIRAETDEVELKIPSRSQQLQSRPLVGRCSGGLGPPALTELVVGLPLGGLGHPFSPGGGVG